MSITLENIDFLTSQETKNGSPWVRADIYHDVLTVDKVMDKH